MGWNENLKKLMDEHGETCYRLSKSLGLQQSTVGNWVNGVHYPGKLARLKLARHFKVPVSTFDAEKEGGSSK